jgi:hypothetical protein
MSGIIDTVGAKSGIVGSDVYPVGHVLQTEYAEHASYTSSASSTFQVKHTAVVTITPRYASSKILLVASFATYMATAGYASYDFYKNASDFTETYNLSGLSYGLATTENHANKWTNHITLQYRDNASSTTEKTYGISGNSSGNAQAMYIGWGGSQLVTITAMEIAQ